jgi:hypothetical protein
VTAYLAALAICAVSMVLGAAMPMRDACRRYVDWYAPAP